MAKAVNDVSTWILLRDAKSLVTKTYQASGLAERLLVRWLVAGKVRWRCLGMEGRKQDSDPGMGDPEFWRETDAGSGPGPSIILLRVNWSESAARRNGLMGYTAYRVELAREDIVKLLPGVAESTTIKEVGGDTWIAAEARRMKAAGEIPTTKTAFAQQLASRMEQDRSVRSLNWRSISNQLRSWDLWPPSSI